MNQPKLTKKQLKELDVLFDLVSERQLKDFGNISARNKSDGSLITSCDLWSDQTIVNGLSSIIGMIVFFPFSSIEFLYLNKDLLFTLGLIKKSVIIFYDILWL